MEKEHNFGKILITLLFFYNFNYTVKKTIDFDKYYYINVCICIYSYVVKKLFE